MNKERYLEDMSQSDWHGPYKADKAECFLFYSIVGSGDNLYFAALQFFFDNSGKKEISLFFKSSESYFWIAPRKTY